MSDVILDVKDLYVRYTTDDMVVNAINGISFSVNRGETLGLVGETGAGKSTTALSIMRLLPRGVGALHGGSIHLDEYDLYAITEEDMRLLRGAKVSMIFQDPMTSLNPVLTVGDQIAEAIFLHDRKMSGTDVSNRVDEMLEMVGIPAYRKNEYPHQFSGGMKQRVVIAIALALDPELLIADEPTTALDVTIQAQVLAMMNELKIKLNTAMILITHDLGVVAQICDRVAVMYAGEIIESGTVEDLYRGERHHPYTVGLFGSIPDLDHKTERLSPIDGLMPDPANLPPGCKFHVRCPKCMERCKTQEPDQHDMNGHVVKCHLFSHGGGSL